MSARLNLSPAVKDAIWLEAERIAALEDEWQPTYENLCKVVERTQAAEAKAAGRKPTPSASKKNTEPDERCLLVLVRDAKKNSDGFAVLALREVGRLLGWNVGKVLTVRDKLIESGRLAKKECKAESNNRTRLGYRITESGWRFLNTGPQPILSYEANPVVDDPAKQETERIALPSDDPLAKTPKTPRKRRSKKSEASNQHLLLGFLCGTMRPSGNISTASLGEICKALDWSTMKLLEVRTDLLDAGRLIIVGGLAVNGQPTYGYRITESGWHFLSTSQML